MKDEDIFELAETHGWRDDFGRWNFNDDGLIWFVLGVQRTERERTEREWVGLTDEEIEATAKWADKNAAPWHIEFARAIEVKLKEKNT